MRIEHLHAPSTQTRHGLCLRRLHGIQHRIKQVKRDHHEHVGQRIAALQLPRNARGVRGDLLRARLRPQPVGFHIFLERDVAQSVAIGVLVRQMWPLTGIGIGEYDFRADLAARADGLGERVGRLDGHINRAVFLVLVVVQDDRHFRQPLNGAKVGIAQRCGQLDGELEFSRDHRKVREPAALETARIR